MTLETGVLVSMGIGVLGAAVLTGWCLYSRYCEKRSSKQ